MDLPIPSTVIDFCRLIERQEAGIVPPRAFLVGGAVRDALLGVEVKDLDLEVYGLIPEKLTSLVEQFFGEKVNTIGASFGILKVRIENQAGELIDLDISLPRTESKVATGHRGFAIKGDPFLSTKEACRRRDFTINALLFDPLTGELKDFFGGQADLQHKTLRVVDETAFTDDPLRVFRAVQFAARFDFEVESKTVALIKKMVDRGDLEELSADRITDEWKKWLKGAKRPSYALNLLNDWGIIDKYYPEIAALKGCPQEREWHPEGDVWTHTLMVVDVAVRFGWETVLAGLCHDFGKPATTKTLEGRIRSIGHSEAGMLPARQFLSRFTFGDNLTEKIAKLVLFHLQPSIIERHFSRGAISKVESLNMVRKIVRDLAPAGVEELLALGESDVRGRAIKENQTGPYLAGEHFRLLFKELEQTSGALAPLVGGAEIIAIALELGRRAEPGAWIGRMIKKVEGERDLGTLSTVDEAREFVRKELIRL